MPFSTASVEAPMAKKARSCASLMAVTARSTSAVSSWAKCFVQRALQAVVNLARDGFDVIRPGDVLIDQPRIVGRLLADGAGQILGDRDFQFWKLDPDLAHESGDGRFRDLAFRREVVNGHGFHVIGVAQSEISNPAQGRVQIRQLVPDRRHDRIHLRAPVRSPDS